MYVPSAGRAFGSASKTFKKKLGFTSIPRRYVEFLEVKRVHRTYLDHPTDPCSNEININMTGCIAEYITDKIGCSPNIQGIELTTRPPCKTRKHLEAFANISLKLEDADATMMYDMTGCLSSCEKEKFDIITETSEYTSKKAKGARNDAVFVFTIYNKTYVEEEQYILYDTNSFFADVGGFMGLILGSSILNMYDEFIHVIRQC